MLLLSFGKLWKLQRRSIWANRIDFAGIYRIISSRRLLEFFKLLHNMCYIIVRPTKKKKMFNWSDAYSTNKKNENLVIERDCEFFISHTIHTNNCNCLLRKKRLKKIKWYSHFSFTLALFEKSVISFKVTIALLMALLLLLSTYTEAFPIDWIASIRMQINWNHIKWRKTLTVLDVRRDVNENVTI